MMLLYALNIYRGDEKIKAFIYELITPSEFGGNMKVTKNHSGLSGPIPRGRRGGKKGGKRDSKDSKDTNDGAAWIADEKFDLESNLDKSYRKHLDRHHNKLLLRTRLLYHVHHEILSPQLELVRKLDTPVR